MMDATVLLSISESWDLIKSYGYGYYMVSLWVLKTKQKKEIGPQKISYDATQNKAGCESCRDPFLTGEYSPAKDDL